MKSSLQSPPGSSASGSPITAEFDFQLHGPDSDPAFATYDQQNVNLNPLLPEVPSGTLGSGSGSKIENDSQRPIFPPDLSRPASPEIVFPSIGAHKTTQPGNFSRSDITTNTTNPETAPPAMVQIPPPPRDRVPRNPPTVSRTCGDPYSSTIDGSESYITRLGSRHFGDYMNSDWRQSFPQTHRESALRSTISHQKPSSDNKTREPAGGVSYVDISPSGVLSISSMAPLMDRDSPHSPPQLSPPPQAPPAPAERLAQAREAIAPFMREKSLLSPQDISAGRYTTLVLWE